MGFVFIVALILDVFNVLVGGWMLSNLWGWFVAPTFGLPGISIIQAVGLTIIISFLSKRTPNPETDYDIEVVVMEELKVFVSMFVMFCFSIFM